MTAAADLKQAFRHELDLAAQHEQVGDFTRAWHHLERAHILGQRRYLSHVHSHYRMLRLALAQSDGREVAGQITRLIGAGPFHLVGWVPLGNTGGANVSPVQPMPLPEDIRPYFAGHSLRRGMIVRAAIALAVLALVFVFTATRAQAGGQYPDAVQGVWMADDADGRAQCERYRAVAGVEGDDRINQLVGAEVVSPQAWHSFAEYGEGNFYFIRDTAKIGPQAWRFTAAVGIDTAVDDGDLSQATFRARIEGRQMIWVFESFDGTPVDSWDEQRLFRCAPLSPLLKAD